MIVAHNWMSSSKVTSCAQSGEKSNPPKEFVKPSHSAQPTKNLDADQHNGLIWGGFSSDVDHGGLVR